MNPMKVGAAGVVGGSALAGGVAAVAWSGAGWWAPPVVAAIVATGAQLASRAGADTDRRLGAIGTVAVLFAGLTSVWLPLGALGLAALVALHRSAGQRLADRVGMPAAAAVWSVVSVLWVESLVVVAGAAGGVGLLQALWDVGPVALALGLGAACGALGASVWWAWTAPSAVVEQLARHGAGLVEVPLPGSRLALAGLLPERRVLTMAGLVSLALAGPSLVLLADLWSLPDLGRFQWPTTARQLIEGRGRGWLWPVAAAVAATLVPGSRTALRWSDRLELFKVRTVAAPAITRLGMLGALVGIAVSVGTGRVELAVLVPVLGLLGAAAGLRRHGAALGGTVRWGSMARAFGEAAGRTGLPLLWLSIAFSGLCYLAVVAYAPILVLVLEIPGVTWGYAVSAVGLLVLVPGAFGAAYGLVGVPVLGGFFVANAVIASVLADAVPAGIVVQDHRGDAGSRMFWLKLRLNALSMPLAAGVMASVAVFLVDRPLPANVVLLAASVLSASAFAWRHILELRVSLGQAPNSAALLHNLRMLGVGLAVLAGLAVTLPSTFPLLGAVVTACAGATQAYLWRWVEPAGVVVSEEGLAVPGPAGSTLAWPDVRGLTLEIAPYPRITVWCRGVDGNTEPLLITPEMEKRPLVELFDEILSFAPGVAP